jgi:hypothetical protein
MLTEDKPIKILLIESSAGSHARESAAWEPPLL